MVLKIDLSETIFMFLSSVDEYYSKINVCLELESFSAPQILIASSTVALFWSELDALMKKDYLNFGFLYIFIYIDSGLGLILRSETGSDIE